MMKALFALGFVVELVAALPQVVTPAPTGQACSTRTRTQLGIEATITNYPEFVSSMDQHWSTSGVPFSGTERVIVYTSLETFDGGSFTGYYTYDINALRSAGYTITTSTQVSVSCYPTATSSAVGECEPHGDHWHCPPGVSEPITPPSPQPHTTHSAPSSGECEAHDDHWHCPPGVTEPTTPPAPSSTPVPTTPGSDECEAHGDHLHCHDGVPEPTTPPPVITPTPTSFSSVTASTSFTRTASDAPVVTAGADAKTRVGSHFLVLAAGVPFVFGMM